MFGDKFEVLEKLKTPQGLVQPAQAWQAKRDEIQRQQYKPERESIEFQQADEVLKQQWDEWQQGEEQRIDDEATKAVASVESSINREQAIPGKLSSQTDGEHAASLTRTLIHDVRAATAATRADTDVRLALALNDPTQIENILADSFLTRDSDVIRRVGLAVETRLQRLATLEHKQKVINGEASRASGRVNERLRTWRSEQHDASPSVQRQKILDAATFHKSQVRTARENATRGLGLEGAMQQIARNTAVESARAALPKNTTGMPVFGAFWERQRV